MICKVIYLFIYQELEYDGVHVVNAGVGTVLLDRVRKQESGLYVCEASNSENVASQEYTVHVLRKLKQTRQII